MTRSELLVVLWLVALATIEWLS